MKPDLKIDDNDFVLFGLPERFALERSDVDVRWRELQGWAHPDRFAAEGAAAQRAAMQWSVRINEAHRRLRDPLSRAAYLCELRGAPIEAQRNTAMPRDFLAQQMAWREALDDAQDVAVLAALERDVLAVQADLFSQLRALLDEQPDATQAAERVRALMFTQRFHADLGERIDAAGH